LFHLFRLSSEWHQLTIVILVFFLRKAGIRLKILKKSRIIEVKSKKRAGFKACSFKHYKSDILTNSEAILF